MRQIIPFSDIFIVEKNLQYWPIGSWLVNCGYSTWPRPQTRAHPIAYTFALQCFFDNMLIDCILKKQTQLGNIHLGKEMFQILRILTEVLTILSGLQACAGFMSIHAS